MAVGEYCKGRLVFGVVVVLGVVLFPCMLVQDVDVKTEPLFWQKYKQPSCKTILAMIERNFLVWAVAYAPAPV